MSGKFFKMTCLILHLALCTVLSAQWLETTIQVGNEPCALVWNSLNNKIYCANYGSINLAIIDGESNSVITTVPLGFNPVALVWNSINNKIYCAG
jgi:YVTN family beta-propeller protein